ncbi:hypothetical protein K438DRAFT_2139048 [Mycena galopus ATCC 62051]|nr:hypothetical protein K438DRAFT_2139048 [Mycena galopus ATCC 62051]
MSIATVNSPVFLITGCSSGLGHELALAALRSSFCVIATARRMETLASLEQQDAKVDYLVNNAGFLQARTIEEVSPSEALHQFNTNFFGLLKTTAAFLPHLRARRAGTIINISSQGSALGSPGGRIYCALKATPGAFHTEVLKFTNVSRAVKFIKGYELAHGFINYTGKMAGLEPGDPAKATKNIIEFVADPECRHQLLLRFVIGEDVFVSLKAFYTQRLADMETAE